MPSLRPLTAFVLLGLSACAGPPSESPPLHIVGPLGVSNGRTGVSVSVDGAYDLEPLDVRLVTYPELEAVDAVFAPTPLSGRAILYELAEPEMLEDRWYAALVRPTRADYPVSPTAVEMLADGSYVYPFFGGSRPMIRNLSVVEVSGVSQLHVDFSEPVSIDVGELESSIRAVVGDVECTSYGEGPWLGDSLDFACGAAPAGRVSLEILSPIPARDGDGVLEPRSIVLDAYARPYSDPLG